MIKFDWDYYPEHGMCISLDGADEINNTFKRKDLLDNLEEIIQALIGEML